MQMKFPRLLLSFALFTLTVLPMAAQDSTQPWFIYLFDNVNGELIRVYNTGEMEIDSLGLEEGEFANRSDMAISDDGTMVAFCKYALTETNTARTLIVRDIAANANLYEAPLEAGYEGCRPTGFNADGSQFVLSTTAIMNFDPQTGAVIEADVPLWRIQIMDTASGEVVNEINSTMPDMPSFDDTFGRITPVPLMADVIEFTDTSILFRGLPYVGMEIPGELPAWSWNLSDNTVTSVPNVGRINSAYLPQTGELAYPALDESFPAAQPGGPMSQANVVNIQTTDGSIQTIYRNSEEVIVSVSFVNDGQAVGVTLLEGFDQSNPDDTFTQRHIIIDRGGQVTDIGQPFDQTIPIEGVPGGAVVVWAVNDAQGYPVTHLASVENGALREIMEYQPPMDRGYSFLEIVWTPPTQVTGELPPFTPAAQ